MNEEKSLLEVFEEVKQNDLDFLPPDPAVREGFMAFIQLMTLVV